MAFKQRPKARVTVESPEALFRDRRNRSVEGLLSHQADILRRYQSEGSDKPNVAIELPTGSGKTLVGVLIGEYRRQMNEEKVVYLCPTRQLVKQVVAQSMPKYGIKTTAFIGSQKEYLPSDRADYLNGNTIAVTTYSALFNTNSFFSQANVIILDDAHASENYIASFWSVSISRTENKDVYLALLSILKSCIPAAQYERYILETPGEHDFNWVEKVPSIALESILKDITAILDVHTDKTDLYFPWSVIKGNLNACHFYLSWSSMLIRPVIPPSLTHKPFANANQRIFMSATLGSGGDLERITGISKFHRIPVPEGWDKQGVGRRFFMFPELSLKESEALDLVSDMTKHTPRTLILVPDDKSVENLKNQLKKSTEYKVFSAADIERSKEEFTTTDKAVAILASRFDGIDLVGDECRLLIIKGLPKATNLQERFFDTRMAANTLLNDRIRTRVVQAIGRCTRSATDFAAVCVLGEELLEWFVLKEKRQFLHPELQGEVIFGKSQSEETSAEEFITNLDIFFDHGAAWNEVDQDIVSYRDEAKKVSVPGEEKLLKAAEFEVEYQYAIWQGYYDRAIEKANQVLANLDGEQVKGYRGFWYYLIGSAAWMAYQEGRNEFENVARDNFRRAASCTNCVSWLHKISHFQSRTKREEQPDYHLVRLIENLENVFIKYGMGSTQRLEKQLSFIGENIASRVATDFEEAQKRLGLILGYYADNHESTAAPDPWWIVGEDLCIVFEDKTDGDDNSPVSVAKIRQATLHPNWIIENVPNLHKEADIIPIMVTTARNIDSAATAFAEDVLYWYADDFRKWADEAMATIRRVRANFPGSGDLFWRDSAMQEFKQAKLDPNSIIGMLAKLKDLPVITKKESEADKADEPSGDKKSEE